VAEWQTRQTQNLLSERTWEFKSPRPHHLNQFLDPYFACGETVGPTFRSFVPSLSRDDGENRSTTTDSNADDAAIARPAVASRTRSPSWWAI
jgi:hypothetical protein